MFEHTETKLTVFVTGKLFITCNKLYGILLQGTYNLLILETRSEEEFLQSHMKFNNCINIPSNCIQKGYVCCMCIAFSCSIYLIQNAGFSLQSNVPTVLTVLKIIIKKCIGTVTGAQ